MKQRSRRMALSLKPDLEAALFDLADALDKPAATLATELLSEMIPQLEGMAKFARLAKQGKQAAAKKALSHAIGDSLAALLVEDRQMLLPGTRGKK